uniref:Uncharacterized protein n=1 Tax=Arundo donax TaxID=35708 RepID=A0A0A8YCE3_ARUDO
MRVWEKSHELKSRRTGAKTSRMECIMKGVNYSGKLRSIRGKAHIYIHYKSLGLSSE